jgi:hypothetical protein
MATWSDVIYGENRDQRDLLIDTSYVEAITTFNSRGVADFSYRELKWQSGDIVRASDNLSSASFTQRQKLKYFPQLVQMVDIGCKQVLYPI